MADDKLVHVVDDEDSIRRLLTRWLAGWGYESREAANADKAIEQMTAEPAAIILCDVMMPEMTGTELAAAMRHKHPEIPILFVTGYVGEAGEAEELIGGELLRKPFTVAALAAAVERALGSEMVAEHPRGHGKAFG